MKDPEKPPVPQDGNVEALTMALPDGSSLLTQIKQSKLIVAYCLALASGIVLYGYDLAIVGNVSSMPAFQLSSPRPSSEHRLRWVSTVSVKRER